MPERFCFMDRPFASERKQIHQFSNRSLFAFFYLVLDFHFWPSTFALRQGKPHNGKTLSEG